MQQNEIDELFKKSDEALKELNKREKEIKRKSKLRGKVIEQLTRITEESEKGSNIVMDYLEQTLNNLADLRTLANENKLTKRKFNEILAEAENNLYSALDAFQFQDITRQKLLKVMYILAKLHEYLTDLLGFTPDEEEVVKKAINKKIEERDAFSDDINKEVEKTIEEFKKTSNMVD